MLATERRDLLPAGDPNIHWAILDGITPLEETIPLGAECGTPWIWRDRFITRFQEIIRDR